MKTKLAVAIFSGLILAVTPLVGCGETDDPVGNNGNGNGEECESDSDCSGDEVCEDNKCVEPDDNGVECQDDSDCSGDEVCEDNECVDPNGGGDDPECESDTDCPGDQICEGEGEDAECVDPPFEFDCEVNQTFYGQIGYDEDTDHSGGEPTTTPFDTDAGLGDLLAAIEAEIDGPIDGAEDEVCLATQEKRDYEDDGEMPYEDCTELSEPVEIRGATVTAVEFIGFWVQDSEAAFYVFNSNNNQHISIDNPNVGQKVNFDVEIAGTYFGDTQITGLSNWDVEEDDADVFYHEIAEGPITNDEHYNQIVRFAGQLGTGENDQWDCGSHFGNEQVCYNMYYGTDGDHEVTFRTSKEHSIWEQGDCITYVGPVQSFPGYYSENGEPQIQETEWDWTSWPSFE